MRTVRITAKTIEAAVAEGLEKLGISREEAVVHVVEQPSSGLFGLIHKKMAVVDISAPDEEAEEDTVEEASPAEEAPAAEIPAEEAKEETPAEEPKAEEAAEEVKEEAPAEEKKAEREEPTFDPEEQKKVAEEAKTFLAGVFAGMHLAVTRNDHNLLCHTIFSLNRCKILAPVQFHHYIFMLLALCLDVVNQAASLGNILHEARQRLGMEYIPGSQVLNYAGGSIHPEPVPVADFLHISTDFQQRQSDIDAVPVENTGKIRSNNHRHTGSLDGNRRMLTGRTAAEILFLMG